MTLKPTRMAQALQRGFTLIELMVVIMIVGVLSAIAYPAYSDYLIKGSRAAAQSHLQELALAQQQYLADNRVYADTIAKLNVAPAGNVTDFYTIPDPVVTATPPTFVLSAVPISTKRNKNDGTLTISNTGAKMPVGKW
jgi:type IV pilus assembly protein PilE